MHMRFAIMSVPAIFTPAVLVAQPAKIKAEPLTFGSKRSSDMAPSDSDLTPPRLDLTSVTDLPVILGKPARANSRALPVK
jgi:hypothetical protein